MLPGPDPFPIPVEKGRYVPGCAGGGRGWWKAILGLDGAFREEERDMGVSRPRRQ